jgi:hypothetical protein
MYILDKIYEIHGVVNFDAVYKLLIVLHRVRLMRRCCNTGLLLRLSSVHSHTDTVLEEMHLSYSYLLKLYYFLLCCVPFYGLV